MSGLDAPLVWTLIATALAFLTIPGIGLVYGGMVRGKNVVSTVGLAFLALLLATVVALLISAIDRDPGLFDGGLEWIRALVVSGFALALIAGAVAERVSWAFFAGFGVLWLAAVYWPLAYAVWGGGPLSRLGMLDFAGGGVVHLSAGVSALVAAIVMGPRRGYGRADMLPNALPLSACGAGLLWIGWVGLAGVAPITMTAATGAFVAIHCAAAAAALTWTMAEWWQRDKPTVLGTVSGAVSGLIGISAAAAYVGPLAAVTIGVGAGGACYMAVNFVKPILRYDDALDVFGMHGVAGLWSLVATGLFASAAVNPAGNDGLFYGYPYQFLAQLASVLGIVLFSAAGTRAIIALLQWRIPMRVSPETELIGLDLGQHGERGYS